MIIKTKTAIVDTNTYDSFYIEYSRYDNEYRLLAVNNHTADTILLYSDKNKENIEKLLEIIYEYLGSDVNRLDLGV